MNVPSTSERGRLRNHAAAPHGLRFETLRATPGEALVGGVCNSDPAGVGGLASARAGIDVAEPNP